MPCSLQTLLTSARFCSDTGWPPIKLVPLSIRTKPILAAPTFSPDGQSIYFTSDRGGSPQIYRMSVSGGRAEQISRLGNQALSPSISPDGQHMAYIAYQGSAYRVAILDLKSGETRIISDTSDDERPSFAPNGKAVLYATRTKGRETLMISSLDGRIKASLVSTLADVRAPQWGRYVR